MSKLFRRVELTTDVLMAKSGDVSMAKLSSRRVDLTTGVYVVKSGDVSMAKLSSRRVDLTTDVLMIKLSRRVEFTIDV